MDVEEQPARSDAETLHLLPSASMSTQALQLARLFTPGYAARINVQLVYPAQSVIVKPSELSSALVRPLQTARYEPHRSAEYLAATLAYGMIQGH